MIGFDRTSLTLDKERKVTELANAERNMATMNMSEKLHTIFDGTACPRCNCNDAARVKTVDLGDGAFIRSCDLCNWATGVDDSVDLCDLGEENWEFQPDDGESGSCLGNTNHNPICMGFSQFGLIRSRCRKCKKTGIMFHKGDDFNRLDGEFRDVDSVFGIMFKNMTEECDTANEESLLTGMLQELTENDELSECMPPFDVDKEDKLDLVCDCGNDNQELFHKLHNSFDSAIVLTCMVCDSNYSSDPESCTAHVICERCNNNVEDCFDKTYESGKLTRIKCLVCDTAKIFSKTHHRVFTNTGYIHQDRVLSWDMIERGNHISWQRAPSYEHHAIVLSVHPHDKKIKFVEYGFNVAMINGKPTIGVVREKEETIEDFDNIFLYRYDYDPENCYPPEEVVERAQSRIEERLYDVFVKNCEHFSTWCKTGKEYCSQIVPFARRVGQSIVAFISQLPRQLIDLIKDEVFQVIVSGAAFDDVVDFTVQQIMKMKVDKAFTVGRIKFTVLLNLIVELYMFYYNYMEAKKEFDTGKITKTEFRKRKFQLIGESIGGLTLGLLLGFTWLLGLGIFWTLILNILGLIGGRLCGAWIGRKLHNLTLKS